MTTIPGRLQLRYGTAAQFASLNPVLLLGEPAFESDTKDFRIGDGATAYNLLPAFPSAAGLALIYQAISPILTSLAGLTLTANEGLMAKDANTVQTFPLTDVGLAVVGAATVAAQQTALGLGTAALKNVTDNADLTINIEDVPTRANVAAAIAAGFGSTLGANNGDPGRINLGQGLIMEWGTTGRIGALSTLNVPFQQPLKTACFNVQATRITTDDFSGDKKDSYATINYSVAGFTIFNQYETISSAYNWLMIGM